MSQWRCKNIKSYCEGQETKISLAQYTNVNGKSRTEMERWVWICYSLRHLSVCNICLLCVWLSDSSLGFKALSRSSIFTLLPVQFFYFQPVCPDRLLLSRLQTLRSDLLYFSFFLFCSVISPSYLIFLSVFNGLKSGSPLTPPPSVHIQPPCPLSL